MEHENPEPQPREEIILQRAVARLRAGIMAITFGMTGGAGIFLATVWLVVRGGENVGQHLGLLRFYMPGYTVTWGGALVGAFYGAAFGAVVGGAIATLYNRVAQIRETPRS